MATPSLGGSQHVALLNNKLFDADPDIRYMSLSDLLEAFSHPNAASYLAIDYQLCAKTVEGFLHTLNDSNGEVQNMTVKCLGPFVLKAHPDVLCPMIHKISSLPMNGAVDSSIPALAVRAIVVALPRPTASSPPAKPVIDAYSAVSKVLIPRLVGYVVITQGDKNRPDPPKGLLQTDLETGRDSSSIDILIEVARCFGSMLQPAEVKALQKITIQLLESEHTGSVMKKKAVAALSALAHFFSDSLLSSVLSNLIESLKSPHLTLSNRRLYMNMLGSIARAIPSKFGPHLKTLAPFALAALSQEDLDEQMELAMEAEEERDPQADEVREAALVAIESFWSYCTNDMLRFNDESINATLRFIKYDPNIADDDDDEMNGSDADEDDEFELDEDFEEEGGGDDEDDISWKVRRCAAKTLHTMIFARGKEIFDKAGAYDKIGKSLLDRFKEREETVRLEILGTLAFMIRQTGEPYLLLDPVTPSAPQSNLSQPPQGRKRRRGDSDVSMIDPIKIGRFTGSTSPEPHPLPSRGGPSIHLSKISADIVRADLKLIKSSTPATKQAGISLLKDLVVTQQGGLADNLNAVVTLLVETIKSPGGDSRSRSAATTSSSASGSANNIQIEALHLIGEITKLHSSTDVQPHMAKVIPVVITIMKSKSPKVASEAIGTVEQLFKALTPPRSASSNAQSSSHIEQLLDTIMELIGSKQVDLIVRQRAINALGTVLGRTLGIQGQKLISVKRKKEAFDLLYETTKNEVTRYAAIRSIDVVGSLASKKTDIDHAWFSKVCLELGAQLRKSDRALRGASLLALRTLMSGHGSENLDDSSSAELMALLTPLLNSTELQLLGPCLIILASMIQDGKADITTNEFNKQFADLVKSATAAPVLEELTTLVQAAGERGVGKSLMSTLLSASIYGTPSVVGRLVGTLLVAGGNSTGQKPENFLKELENTTDDLRKCLALSVLGEVGLRSSSSSLTPELFISYFSQKENEVSLTAAIALGRAAAGPGNVQRYVPNILSRIESHDDEQYQVLHSIKELLQYNEREQEILPFGQSLWDATVASSRSEDNKTIGAECLANLAMIDSKVFLPQLQALLNNDAPILRGTAILALRDVFTLTDGSYDKFLRPLTVDSLTTVMRDSNLENRRSALGTFNAAARNKAALILPCHGQLMPLVFEQSVVDPGLIREVSMGPFKHKVDDGLEVRKAAYETLYSMTEIAPSRIDTVTLYDRVVAGISDDQGIRNLCNLLVTKLMISHPEETLRRLEDIAEKFQAILGITLKDNAVRHEFEKADEAKRGVIKTSLELNRAFNRERLASAGPEATGGYKKWFEYLDLMRRDHATMVKDAEKELREKDKS